MSKRAHGEGTLSKRSDGTWEGKVSLGYDVSGKRRRKTVYGKTRQEVKGKLDELKRQVSNGTFSDTKLTVKQYLEEWLTNKSLEVKARTADDYGYALEKYIIPRIGSVQLTKLTPLRLQAMLREVAEVVSADRANKCRRILYGAFQKAVRWQLIPRNPVDAVDAFKQERKPMTLWTMIEAARFLDASRGHRLYALFYLAMSTGLRCGELLGLEWEDINGTSLNVRRSLTHVRGKLHISTPKTRKGERRVALSPDVLEVLELHRQGQEAERRLLGAAWPGTDLVFTSIVGTWIHPRNLARTWYLLQDAAKVTHIRLHDLRHLHASIAIKEGMDPKMLADRLGHARPSFTLDVYTHLFEEQRDNSAVSIAHLLVKARADQPN